MGTNAEAPGALDPETLPPRRVAHPFRIRLKETAAFCVTAPNALVGAGFASFCLGMFALFRPSPVLFYSLVFHLSHTSSFLTESRLIFLFITLVWTGILTFVLFGLGLMLALSWKIKNRAVLLLHPWGLTLLYLDIIFWLSMTLILHIEVAINPSTKEDCYRIYYEPAVAFTIIYVDGCVYFLGYYAFATYFIAAELTLIERFF